MNMYMQELSHTRELKSRIENMKVEINQLQEELEEYQNN